MRGDADHQGHASLTCRFHLKVPAALAPHTNLRTRVFEDLAGVHTSLANELLNKTEFIRELLKVHMTPQPRRGMMAAHSVLRRSATLSRTALAMHQGHCCDGGACELHCAWQAPANLCRDLRARACA